MKKGKMLLVASLSILVSLTAFAPTKAHSGEWIADARTGCQVWNPSPIPGETIEWSGACLNGKADGAGVLQWRVNGAPVQRFDGVFRVGRLNGKGSRVDFDREGRSYREEGDYVNGTLNGKGSKVFKNGSRDEGDYVNGSLNGKGSRVFMDGYREKGDFVNDKLHGNGKRIWSETSWYEGAFVNGKREGFGVMRLSPDAFIKSNYSKIGYVYGPVAYGMWQDDAIVRKFNIECTSERDCIDKEDRKKASDEARARSESRAWEAKIAKFRSGLKVGADTSIGIVTAINGDLVKVQTSESQCTQRDYDNNCRNWVNNSVEKWVKRIDLYPKE